MSDTRTAKDTLERSADELRAIVLDDVSLKFRLRYYRQRRTLRGEIVGGISKALRARRRSSSTSDFWALRGVTLAVHQGESLGIIGYNGSGKSTLLRVMAGIYAPDRGAVTTHGSIATLLSFGAGFDARQSGRDNIYHNGILLGLKRQEIGEIVDGIIELSGLDEFIDAPVSTYSAGMKARLGFAIAAHVRADILLVDEVIGAGDERFRARAGNIFDQLRNRKGTTVFVTHSMQLLKEYCTRAIWLHEGKVRLEGAPADVAKVYVNAAKQS